MLSANFSTETLQARKEWHNIFQVIKEKNLQQRILYPVRLSFRFDGEIKSLPDKQSLRKFSTVRPAAEQTLRELLLAGTQEKEKIYKNKPKTINKMVTGSYILIIILNVNGLNAPT